ncbi:GNAT family N-acetyltransferase [Actinotalea sp. M2MS4P-6]|uniref:GNAT family N-acetyltransferase n=1 Tax=Actinotalea sp. M2MS4P-6 TaxID=2983762 RepID=UPI0021E49B89|nr:GNAT family N-acetyltransferase [Actinotalea sp. M2MS4P-6]MCV2393535.1 GNAT family N-acetyltransferase [Actinotalea sp. M2MS4P-6]
MDLTPVERYYDAAPRPFASVEQVGPFTVFVGRAGGWQFSARPRPGGTGAIDARAVGDLLRRMRALDVPLALEWVADTAPGLLAAVREEGTLATIEELPLMVRTEPGPDHGAPDVGAPDGGAPDGVTVRVLGPGDAHLLRAVGGVQAVAFGSPRTPPAGPSDRDSAAREPSADAVALLRAGTSRVVVAEHVEHGVVAAGRHIPVDGVSEVVGVAVLPSLQGHGLGSAVTSALVADAEALGIGTLFLTAEDERVATLYRRLGFRRVGTGYVAEA